MTKELADVLHERLVTTAYDLAGQAVVGMGGVPDLWEELSGSADRTVDAGEAGRFRVAVRVVIERTDGGPRAGRGR